MMKLPARLEVTSRTYPISVTKIPKIVRLRIINPTMRQVPQKGVFPSLQNILSKAILAP